MKGNKVESVQAAESRRQSQDEGRTLKEQQLDALYAHCRIVLQCSFCGNTEDRSDLAYASDLAESAYFDGWRFQKLEFNGKTDEEESLLCPACTENKR